MFDWIDSFYGRLRPLMDPRKREALDWHTEMGGYAIVLGDCIEFAAPSGLITDEDRNHIHEILEFGLLRPVRDHFEALLTV